MGKLVPAPQRIRKTKFEHQWAIKLVYIACELTEWSATYYMDPDYFMILETVDKAMALGIIEILSIYMNFFPLPLSDIAHSKLLLAPLKIVRTRSSTFSFTNIHSVMSIFRWMRNEGMHYMQ